GVVEVVVILLYVLAVVALGVREAEEPLLYYGVLPVPKGEREAEDLPFVGDAGESVLAPPVCTRAGVVVGEVVPRSAVFAVILPYRPPLPLAQVGAPFLPGGLFLPRLYKP